MGVFTFIAKFLFSSSNYSAERIDFCFVAFSICRTNEAVVFSFEIRIRLRLYVYVYTHQYIPASMLLIITYLGKLKT
jgi:hypothetical protein